MELQISRLGQICSADRPLLQASEYMNEQGENGSCSNWVYSTRSKETYKPYWTEELQQLEDKLTRARDTFLSPHQSQQIEVPSFQQAQDRPWLICVMWSGRMMMNHSAGVPHHKSIRENRCCQCQFNRKLTPTPADQYTRWCQRTFEEEEVKSSWGWERIKRKGWISIWNIFFHHEC